MSRDIKVYGVKQATQVSSEIDRAVEEIQLNGYAILEGLLPEEEVAAARRGVEEVYQFQLEELGGEANLKQINDAYVVRCVLAYNPTFLNIATHPRVIAVLEKLLGNYFILQQQNGIINPPGEEHYQISWHRDLPYQHFVSNRPLAVSALFCLDDFRLETGGTVVLPGSHKSENFPSVEFVHRYETSIKAKAGSALVFDAMLYHRAGKNRSVNNRIGLNHAYTLPFIKQQISLPKILEGQYQEDPFLRRFLGYESEVATSVIEWRRHRLNRELNSKS